MKFSLVRYASDHAEEAHLKGWQKYYNTYTIIGRRNIAYSTFAMLGVLGLYLKFKPSKKTTTGHLDNQNVNEHDQPHVTGGKKRH
ncbi:hypothetical protein RvY_09448-2 [Ramazzottius varieornatus]|nr:hypothetical protein RvY_09448-2 [Ramazzottius varieornatus]